MAFVSTIVALVKLNWMRYAGIPVHLHTHIDTEISARRYNEIKN